MAQLIYSAIASLDGYVADETGDFSWAEPDAEVHEAVNDVAWSSSCSTNIASTAGSCTCAIASCTDVGYVSFAGSARAYVRPTVPA
jgi:hypothetical protein